MTENQPTASEKIWAAFCEEASLDCPLCDGEIELTGQDKLVCNMCDKEWSADDVAKRNRL